MNILITGGAGHIGSFLFRELLKLKKIVIVKMQHMFFFDWKSRLENETLFSIQMVYVPNMRT